MKSLFFANPQIASSHCIFYFAVVVPAQSFHDNSRNNELTLKRCRNFNICNVIMTFIWVRYSIITILYIVFNVLNKISLSLYFEVIWWHRFMTSRRRWKGERGGFVLWRFVQGKMLFAESIVRGMFHRAAIYGLLRFLSHFFLL